MSSISHLDSSTLCSFADPLASHSDVLSVREVDQEKLDYLTRRCREVYVNTRLRTAARPEMLERADGLATTWDEAEKMTIDQWHLLVPMLYEVSASDEKRRVELL